LRICFRGFFPCGTCNDGNDMIDADANNHGTNESRA
jgi:hypothetical protein